MKRLILVSSILACVSLPAVAQQVPDVPTIDLNMTADDVANFRFTCATAMRSPNITDADITMNLGVFCATMRSKIEQSLGRARQQATNAAAPPPPVVHAGPPAMPKRALGDPPSVDK